MAFFKDSLDAIEVVGVKIAIWFVAFFTLAGPFYSVVESSENLPEQDDLANIDSGFFVFKDDVYGLQDQAFKEKLLFLTENGINDGSRV